MTEEETGVAFINEVRHLVTVATDAGETEGEGLDEDETVGFEVARHAKDVTHVIVLSFLIEGYLTDEVVTGNWILNGIFFRADDIQFDIFSLLPKELEGIVSDVSTLALEILANEKNLIVRLWLRVNQLSVNDSLFFPQLTR